MPLEFDGVNSKVSADKIQGQTGTTVTIESGHSLSGSGASLTNLPAANLTGTVAGARLPNPLPAISGAALTNLPESGEKRNYIIDGDFTQWPDGTAATTPAYGDYTSALCKHTYGNDGTHTAERSTDVPTVDASGHQSTYSQLVKCTVADGTVGSSQWLLLDYPITGTDFTALHEQQVTISFWAKTSAQNSGHTYSLTLSGGSGVNRWYHYNFTPTSTWTQFTHTLTLDTGGTWLFTEADIGMSVLIYLMSPSNWHGTAETWTGPSPVVGTAGNDNFMDNTSNEFYISQLGVYKGSVAPTFSSPPISTVQDQMKYYIEYRNFDTVSAERGGPIAFGNSTTTARMWLTYDKKRKVPTITVSNADTWSTLNGPGAFNTATPSYADIGNYGCRVDTFTRTGGTHTANDVFFMNRKGTDTTFIKIDARH